MSDMTPDLYTTNYGAEVEREARYPQHGQISLRFNHNTYQSTRLQFGLEQAEEMHAKLGEVISQIKETQ